ncbi:hypothetical protein V496_09267 [Pseudogymnoascus sp. VKM F-4515 (FW-2607)]|nr:hypothetical protein V496_09267 [Pseudogymnoascus sp. VKM F-4515 (FW-2607)]
MAGIKGPRKTVVSSIVEWRAGRPSNRLVNEQFVELGLPLEASQGYRAGLLRRGDGRIICQSAPLDVLNKGKTILRSCQWSENHKSKHCRVLKAVTSSHIDIEQSFKPHTRYLQETSKNFQVPFFETPPCTSALTSNTNSTISKCASSTKPFTAVATTSGAHSASTVPRSTAPEEPFVNEIGEEMTKIIFRFVLFLFFGF